ncbi:hypothetical protein [Geobacter sp.]|uniref:hypothetical protein n=1 Tax=Geobacter sp. TaxID=46610 RepID=UPI002623F93B|nr:hypothetical protein [Geobacter sp.]
MRKMRYGVVALWMLLCCSVTSVSAQVSIGIGLPNVHIGINLPLFPELVPVPGYPVYYAPRVDANYFFYDGMYWVFLDDGWYASYWYNGPWWLVEPDVVPLFILRIPVRYYRYPPPYFRGWRRDAPPHWGQHWGREWEHHRRGWDKWKRGSTPHRAPLPVYQRRYSGDRYPQVEEQQQLRRQHYRYQPRDRAVHRHFRQEGPAGPRPAPARQPSPRERGPALREQREEPAPRPHGREEGMRERGRSQEPERGREHGEKRKKEEERGRERKD